MYTDRDLQFVVLGKIIYGDIPDQFYSSFVAQQKWDGLKSIRDVNLALLALRSFGVLEPEPYECGYQNSTLDGDREWEVANCKEWRLIPINQWKPRNIGY